MTRRTIRHGDLIDYQLFRKAAIHSIGGEERTVDCRLRPGYWLNPLSRLGLDQSIVDFIKKVPFYDYEYIGHVAMVGPKKILKWSRYRMICKSGVFLLGSASNGDFVAIDQLGKQTKPGIGYISHESFWNEGSTCEFCRLTGSIGEFFNRVVFDKEFPYDFHQALKLGYKRTALRIGAYRKRKSKR